MAPRAEAAVESLGPPPSAALDGALALAREWAGADALALILGGSHATREAVWIEYEGKPLTLSDLDLYAVLPDPGAVAAAERRWRLDQPVTLARLARLSLAAPIEIAFTTPEGLARMEARPSTLDLARASAVVAGDPAWRERIPRRSAREVSREEILLLLENRAFELLFAHVLAGSCEALDRYRRRHAILKTALDLAGALCLSAGVYPEGAAARVAWARAQHVVRFERLPPWSEALVWRSGHATTLADDAQREEWQVVAEGWGAVWRHAHGAGDADLAGAVRAAARRAPARRRLRQALAFTSRTGRGPGLAERLTFAAAGTPKHRLNAAAVATVHALAGAFGEREWRRAVRPLGVLPRGADPETAARRLVRTWDAWILDGQRTAEWS